MRTIGALLLGLLCSGAIYALSGGDRVAVAVREDALRSTPGFLSAIEARVAYGESVTVLALQGGWVRVRVDANGTEGWLHETSVLPPREMNLEGAARAEGAASTREIALAGRGFSEQVEREYEEQQALDFSIVDAMEAQLLPASELGEFLRAAGAEIAGRGE